MPYAYRVMIDFAQANNRRTQGQPEISLLGFSQFKSYFMADLPHIGEGIDTENGLTVASGA
jgi:hypothetical protein